MQGYADGFPVLLESNLDKARLTNALVYLRVGAAVRILAGMVACRALLDGDASLYRWACTRPFMAASA